MAGRRCDRPSLRPNDACSSNPCWANSICITLDYETNIFKCLCPEFRHGKFCHLKLIDTILEENDENFDENLQKSTNIIEEEIEADLEQVMTSDSSINSNILSINSSDQIASSDSNDFPILKKCSFENCQLGKCLRNGTCECLPPAFGENCDRIDECLVLKCVNVRSSNSEINSKKANFSQLVIQI